VTLTDRGHIGEDVVTPPVLFYPEVVWCEAQCFDQAAVALVEVAVESGFHTTDGRTVAAFFLDPGECRRLQDLLAVATQRVFIAEQRREVGP
jgi:hypothetical protein